MAAKPDGEAALPAGEGLSVVADCEKPPVGDGEAEAALFAGAVSQGAAMVLNVPVLGWTFRISSGVSQGIDKSVVQSDWEFLRIGVDGRR